MAAPAEPVNEAPVTLEIEHLEVLRIPTGDGGDIPAEVLRVTGRLLSDSGDAYPRTMSFGDERRSIRLYAAEESRLSAGDVIVAHHVGHAVYDHQPTHLLADIITPADRGNEALMRIAEHNRDVPVIELKRAEKLMQEQKAPYAEEGFHTFAAWGLMARFTDMNPQSELETGSYLVEVYPTDDRVAAEWTLEVDLIRGVVTEEAVYDIAPEEPDPGE